MMLLKATTVLLLIGASVALKPFQTKTKAETKGTKDEATDYLLPSNVVPSAYDIVLTTHIENFDDSKPESFGFEGEVTITIDVTEKTNTIILHKNEIEIVSAVLQIDADTNKDLVPTYDQVTHKLTLTSADPIEIGKYTLKITYTGTHGDDMHGFYRSSYMKENTPKWLITTQFEAYDARRAFPCFDEPRFKAIYTITIKVHKNLVAQEYSALSNMPLESNEEVGDFNVYKFQPSAKKISSYLVAFIVSDFQPTDEQIFEESKSFKTWGQKRFILDGEAELSQEAGPKALAQMKELTQVSFGYPKLDQIGIPDFSAGAMENWGLVTYRERLIFYKKEKNPTSQRQSVVTTTAHELAHQWFGDLVTLAWWSDIWLNEGFATYFEYHATDLIDFAANEKWNMIGQMVVDELQAGAFATDALPNSRPLTKQVYRPGDIDANFDNVAYSKGGSVLRMWRHIMGEEKFYAALNKYLTEFTEKNVEPSDLLSAFDKETEGEQYKPSVDFVNWHKEAGYPVLTITKKDKKIEITQQRYLVSASEKKDEISTKWTIPINYATDDTPDFTKTSPTVFFKQDQESLTIDLEPKKWVVFNIQQTGFYRVNYDTAGWNALRNQLTEKADVIHEINRAQILDDAFWLARSTQQDYLHYETALQLSLYLANENSLIPWKAALNSFSYLYGKLATDQSAGPLIMTHISNLVAKQFSRLTLNVKDSDSHTDKLLRIQIASWACKLGIKECVDAAVKQGLDNDSTHPDVKSTVICTVVREQADAWDKVWATYKNTPDNAEQLLLLSALGCSKDENTIKKFLGYTLDGTNTIRKQDLPAAFSAVYNGNPENVALALAFLQEKYTEIANTFGGLDPLGGVMTGIAAKLGSDAEKTAFLKINDAIQASTDPNVIKGQVNSKNAVDIVVSNNDWLTKKKASIDSWLKSTYGTDGAATTSAAVFALILPIFITLTFGH